MPDPTTGKPLILAIDDEKEILEVLDLALSEAGYKLITAQHPLEGLRAYERQWKDIDLVLLDYLMPDMTGDLVFEELQRFNPDVRVLLLTACDNHVAQRMLTTGVRGCIQKPFSLDEVQQRIADELDKP